MVNNMQGEICSICGQNYNNADNNAIKGWCGQCCRTCGDRNGELKEGCCNVCKKWRLTVDFIMIVGKYVETNNDFINIMKVCKKYEELVSMYKFNPISDISLFENIQTQHFYIIEDVKNKKDDMYQYIYWFEIDYNDYKNKQDNEIYKNVLLNSKKIDNINREYPLEIKNGNCVIPECITKIGNECFYDCRKLTNISCPASLKGIGSCAFKTSGITTIIIPEGSTKIKSGCFEYCYQLTSVICPSSLRKIGKCAFLDSNINTIIILEGVIKIEDYCFQDTPLINITLPSSLKEIGQGAFFDSDITMIIIPEGVTGIMKKCFKYCLHLTSITLPSTLKEIGDKAFVRTKITMIIIPESVVRIGSKCFKGCDQLTKITCSTRLKDSIEKDFVSGKITSISTLDEN